MKKINLMGVLLISASLFQAQTNNKPVTVRVKKIENINGVEKVTDTTYTTTDVSTLKAGEGDVNIMNWTDDSGSGKKRIVVKKGEISEEIILDNKNGETLKTFTINCMDDGKGEKTIKRIIVNTDSSASDQKTTVLLLDENMQDLDEKLKNLDKELKGLDGKKGTAIFISEDEDIHIKDGEKGQTKIYIIRKVKVIDASEEDKKLVEKQTGLSDNKLALDKINFYPNPNTGKFTLDFTLPEKGNTTVTILNVEGKSVYKEELKDFTGNYQQEIDISSNPKGIYFVKINQGKHAQVKKIILE